MTRSQSIVALNDATSILSRIDVALAKDGWDWSPDTDWWPGDFLYPHPYTLSDSDAGNHVRPMFEIAQFDDTMDSHTRPKCKDCEVSGDPSDETCWMCGGPVPPSWHTRERVMWNSLNPLLAVESYRGFMADYVIYDEALSLALSSHMRRYDEFDLFMDIGYTNIYGVGLNNYRRIVFDDGVSEKPETVEVLVYQSDVDAIQEPPDLLRKDAPLFGGEIDSPPRVSFGQRPYRLSIPCDIPTIVPPTLDMGEPTVVRREVVEGPAYVRFNPSITNQRRRRNI